ncbi:MAG: DUF1080 domain-containing protein [Gemmataceae bacterium]
MIVRSHRSLFALVGMTLVGFWISSVRAEEKGTLLFNGKDTTGWRIFVPKKDESKAEGLFEVKEGGVLHCRGTPTAYIITEKDYEDYVLELEWRWPAKPGNSGVLLHASGPDTIWPKSWEAQLFANNAGDIWLIGGYKLDAPSEQQDPRSKNHFFKRKTEGPTEKKTGEWNRYRITCKGDTVKLEVNGKMLNEGTNSERTKGKIALQSEGAPIEFRNIRLTPIR